MVSLDEWPEGEVYVPDCVGEAVFRFRDLCLALLARAPDELRLLRWLGFPDSLRWSCGEPNESEHETEAANVRMTWGDDASWSVTATLTIVYFNVMEGHCSMARGYRFRELTFEGGVERYARFDVTLSREDLAAIETAAAKPTDDAANAAVDVVCARLAAALPPVR